ncbi:hypothetical protein PO80_24100 [Vibrio parahaemolyticus]|nr:hypothetical protein [Vibrio parahaemolyticus]KHF12218.1 hypothetical protein PO80_24100 [Vibrio parahaemolyticus]OTV95998.1 hypothetical protein BA739_23975 [Vibrio parahaemolyticus]OTW00165.1 hypothetical protein BA740_23975 [Vibrio parahaemolyticus]
MQHDCEDKSHMIKKTKATSKNSKVDHNIKWNEPEPISGYRVVPEAFSIEMLPSNLWNYISVYSNALNNSPADYLGVSLLVSFASLLGATGLCCVIRGN